MAKLELKDFDAKLHQEIRAQAESEDRTLKSWVTRAIREALKKADKSRRWQET
jgi:hypothetical protein